MAKSSDKSEASKMAWERARQLAERDGISVKEARAILKDKPDALETPPKKKTTSKKEATATKKATTTNKAGTTGEKKPRAKKAVDLAAAEATLRAKYPQIIPGTIKAHTEGLHANRRTVEINCANPECRNPKRRVATSDLWQVTRCEECTREFRSKKRSKKTDAETKGQ